MTEKRHQLEKKLTYANHTYNRKRQFYGTEKPEHYPLLVTHYRRKIIEALDEIPRHNKVLFRDKYFVVTYNAKERIFETLSLKTAKQHKNMDYRGRVQDVVSKESYLMQRMKFRNTHHLEAFGEDLQKYVYDIEDRQNIIDISPYENLEDILAGLLYNVSFLPLGTYVAKTGRIDKSLEMKTNDLADHTWIDRIHGVSLSGFADMLLKEAHTNGLCEIGYFVHESEYGDGGSTDQRLSLQDDIRNFIGKYTSSSAYFKQKQAKFREARRNLSRPNVELGTKYGMYVDKRNCRLLLVVIDKILMERDPEHTKQYMPPFATPIETSAGSLSKFLTDARNQEETLPPNNTDTSIDDLPF